MVSVLGSPCAPPPRLTQPLPWRREYRSRFTNTETLLFCMRVMVGVIILYDHVHPVGAFAKTSKIDVSGHGEPRGCRGHPAPPNAATMPAGSLLMEAPQGHPWAARGEFVPPGGAGGTSPHCPSYSVPDEGVHQGPEGAALHQHRGAPERTEVSGGPGDTGPPAPGAVGGAVWAPQGDRRQPAGTPPGTSTMTPRPSRSGPCCSERGARGPQRTSPSYLRP